MKTNISVTALLLSSLLFLGAGCSDDDDNPPPDTNTGVDSILDGGLDSALDSVVDGPGDEDGPITADGPAMDKTTTPDQAPADLPPASTYKVVVTEIMANPTAVSDQNGEWLELHNAGTAAVDITGWTIKDDDKDSHVITAGDAGASLTIAPGQYVALARNASSATNGGVTALYQYDDLFLANSSDEIVLLDDAGKLVDRIVYGSGWKIPGAASLQLKDPALDNDDPANWCAATTAWAGSAGDFGSPGAANTCAAAPDGGTDAAPADSGTDATPAEAGTEAGTDASTD